MVLVTGHKKTCHTKAKILNCMVFVFKVLKQNINQFLCWKWHSSIIFLNVNDSTVQLDKNWPRASFANTIEKKQNMTGEKNIVNEHDKF